MSYFTEYKKRSGLTLVEIMIASSVLLLLVGLFFSVLVPTFRYSARDSIKVEMQQSAMHALNRIEKDLKQTVVGGLSLSPATSSDSLSGLSLVRFIDVGASGAVTWEERAHIYFWAPEKKALYFKTWSSGSPVFSPNRPTKIGSAQLATLISARSEEDQKLASHVSFFSAEHPELPPESGLLESGLCRLTLRFEREAPHHVGPLTFELQRDVGLRNTF